jgi:hypothetical protein
MASGPPMVNMLPYRDVNNTTVAYVPINTIHHVTNPYDSDAEPLIASSNIQELDDDSLQRFTATGRPMPSSKAPWGIGLSGADMLSMPNLLPKRYTDDSIIPAILVDVIPSAATKEALEKKSRKKSITRLLKKDTGEGKNGKGITKVVYMPRRDYLKYFARGLKGEYTGTEPERKWTEEELDEQFAQYQPTRPERNSRHSRSVSYGKGVKYMVGGTG